MRTKNPGKWNGIAMAVALALGVASAGFATQAQAQAQAAETRGYDIPAGTLGDGLKQFSLQSRLQLLAPPELTAGLHSKAVRGSYTAQQALEQLLAGSGLSWQFVNASTVVIKKAEPASAKPAPKPQAKKDAAAQGSADADPTTLDTLTITGTRIRGGTTPSPVITIGAAQIQEEGFTDLGEVIRSVSQNYGGGQNPGVTTGASGGGFYNQNISGGSAANLRGLGQDATLTLLNGRRMSYGAYDQSVDISAIPVAAVERIEIVTDGASAIYGSDAVGGVVNVILKRDFDGIEVGTRHGTATDGGLTTHEYMAIGGATWSTGGLIATWEKASEDPIYADQRDYATDMYGPATLYQGSDLRSGLLSAYQSIGESVELHLDALRTERDRLREYGYATAYYRWPAQTTTTLVSPDATVALPGDWTLNVHAAFGKDQTRYRLVGWSRATGAVALDRTFSYANKSRSYEVDAEGPLFTVPAGEARLALGAGYRDNDFEYLYIGSPVADGGESSRFAYAELNLPVVGLDQHVAGIHRLDVTAAVRAEDYDSYGRVTTPKLGLLYSPSEDFTLKVSWGKSFKAPTLYQRYLYQYSYLYPVTTFGGTGYASTATALYLNGGNEDLKPERARTWSVSLAWHPEALPALDTELTGFSIDYTDRIVQPITVTSTALGDTAYTDFITLSPTSTLLEQILAATQFTNYTGSSYDAANVVAVIDNRFVNAARQKVKGIDLSGSYRFDLGAGRLTLRGSVSWLDSERALTSTSSYSEVTGILFYPAKVQSRLGAVWSQGGFTASLFGNYKSGVKNTTDGTKGASFTTFDTTLRYDTGERDSLFADMSFEFSAENLLNRDPPLYAVTALYNAPYDSTNYSAIGRYLSVSVSKRF
ncbi:MAG: TonB-dependent receptor [Pseudoxanthomonas sp.]